MDSVGISEYASAVFQPNSSSFILTFADYALITVMFFTAFSVIYYARKNRRMITWKEKM